MLKIRKGEYEFVVTSGVFESQFKPLGYEIVKDRKDVYKKDKVEQEPEKDIDKENIEKADKSSRK